MPPSKSGPVTSSCSALQHPSRLLPLPLCPLVWSRVGFDFAFVDLTRPQISSGTSYLDCFRGIDLRRTEIVCGAWACQQLCGSGE